MTVIIGSRLVTVYIKANLFRYQASIGGGVKPWRQWQCVMIAIGWRLKSGIGIRYLAEFRVSMAFRRWETAAKGQLGISSGLYQILMNYPRANWVIAE